MVLSTWRKHARGVTGATNEGENAEGEQQRLQQQMQHVSVPSSDEHQSSNISVEPDVHGPLRLDDSSNPVRVGVGEAASNGGGPSGGELGVTARETVASDNESTHSSDHQSSERERDIFQDDDDRATYHESDVPLTSHAMPYSRQNHAFPSITTAPTMVDFIHDFPYEIPACYQDLQPDQQLPLDDLDVYIERALYSLVVTARTAWNVPRRALDFLLQGF